MNAFFNVMLFALFPVLAAIAGASFAAVRPPHAMARGYIQHLAAGVVFSVVAVELLPDITRQHGVYWEVALGFGLGVTAMLGMKQLSHRLEGSGSGAGRPIGLMIGVGVDVLLDGFLIGISFAAGAKEGTLLTLALTLEMLSLGLAVATALGKVEQQRLKVIGTTSLLFLLLLVGAGLSTALLGTLTEKLLEVVLSFGLAALLYLVTEELLMEAHKEPETPFTTGLFFIGFLVFLLLGMPE